MVEQKLTDGVSEILGIEQYNDTHPRLREIYLREYTGFQELVISQFPQGSITADLQTSIAAMTKACAEKRMEVIHVREQSELDPLIRNQVDRYIELGFHTELYPDIPEVDAVAKYLSDFTNPDSLTPPEEYVDHFKRPLVIDPRVTVTLQLSRFWRIRYVSEELKNNFRSALAKLTLQSIRKRICGVLLSNLTNTVDIPKTPYMVWFGKVEKEVRGDYQHKGYNYIGSLFNIEHFLPEDEVGSPLVEVLAFRFQYPEFESSISNKEVCFAMGTRLHHQSFYRVSVPAITDNGGILFRDPHEPFNNFDHFDPYAGIYGIFSINAFSRGRQITVFQSEQEEK